MKEREFLEYVSTIPVFTTKQISALIGDDRYTKVYLHRLQKRKRINNLKRGFYTVHDDPIIFASHIYYPSYISNWYAFQHYGTTTQLPKIIDVLTYCYDTIQGIEFIKSGNLWGYHTIRYRDFEIFIADLEKAIIDAVVTKRVPIDEIQTAIQQCDIKKLEGYAIKTNNSTIKKIGYLSEELGFMMERAHEQIKLDRNYVKFSGAGNKNRWRIKVDRS
jgi:predicted transcriptional regulator of viral defense system